MKERAILNEFDAVSNHEWKEKIISDLKGKAFEDTLIWNDESNIKHEPFYNKESLDNNPLLDSIQSSQKKTHDWKIVQELNEGKTDLIEHLKYYSDNGVDEFVLNSSIDILDGEKKSPLAYHHHQSSDINLQTNFYFDPLSEALKNDTSTDEALKSLEELFEKITIGENDSKFLLVDGTIYKNAGATIIQELAYTLHHATEYLDLLTDAGYSAESIAKRITFKLGFGTSYFSEIAKTRAFRYLIQQLFNAYSIKQDLLVWGVASSYYHAHKDPHNNLLRLCSQCMSAVVGNCDKISLPSYDELEKSSNLGLRMSKNIALILKEESFFNRVNDISAGSYYIEKLSIEITQKAWDLFLDIENNGGLISIFKNGTLKADLNESHTNRVENYRQSKRSMVGVNKYENEDSKDLKVKSNPNSGITPLILSKEI